MLDAKLRFVLRHDVGHALHRGDGLVLFDIACRHAAIVEVVLGKDSVTEAQRRVCPPRQDGIWGLGRCPELPDRARLEIFFTAFLPKFAEFLYQRPDRAAGIDPLLQSFRLQT
jgi:hypothetical protein